MADGGLKPHAKAMAWELEVGAAAPSNVGFQGPAPISQRANANKAAATDLASELSARVVENGLITGGA